MKFIEVRFTRSKRRPFKARISVTFDRYTRPGTTATAKVYGFLASPKAPPAPLRPPPPSAAGPAAAEQLTVPVR